jgi:riboflavin synthase
MFTGIITDIGTVVAVHGGRYTIRTRYDAASIALGASIACDGCCLTVTTLTPEADGAIFTVDVSNESLAKTTLGSWAPGHPINLERALKVGDELGGHIVSGHVDGVATIVSIRTDDDSQRFTLDVPADLARFISPKGSVALDGTSLTVNEVTDHPNGTTTFGVNLIPHTLTETTWGRKRSGDRVNLEIDMLARYMARLVTR